MINLDQINNDIIGSTQTITTPFGTKPLVYADYTASGRSLKSIEDFIQRKVLPYFANTHTEFSHTGAQMSALRRQARQWIRQSLNANENDAVIFCGSGATAAIDKLVGILGIRLPCKLTDLATHLSEQDKPVVFVGPYEHHSNELPWRESIADVVPIRLDDNGQIDIVHLESELQHYASRTTKIGSFSAASNVSGVISPVKAITQLLHRYQALAFWDFAAAGPYQAIDMNGDTPLDAVFISPHKFLGGPGTPGLLVVKKSLCKNRCPALVGGGTVNYVTPSEHQYHSDIETREEGGTPDIVGSIRAGLVFKVQQHIGSETISVLEEQQRQYVQRRLEAIPNLTLLGSKTLPRLPIFSFRITYNNRDLHHGFVTALLNDLFGIQMRGGCSCAGPYGHHLLNIDAQASKRFQQQVEQGFGGLKPGWVRFNVNYFISEQEREFILNAVELVAKIGFKMLPYYSFDERSGQWCFQNQKHQLTTAINDYVPFEMNENSEPASASLNQAEATFGAQAKIFDALLLAAKKAIEEPLPTWQVMPTKPLPQPAEALRWYATAEDLQSFDSSESVALTASEM